MADEEKRELTDSAPENGAEPAPEKSGGQDNNSAAAAPRRSWFSRRNIVLAAVGIPLLILIVAVVAGFFAVRTGYVGRYIQQQFVAQLDLIGVRAEIGEFQQTFAPLGILMRNVKLYDKATGEQLAKVDSLKLDATVTDLLALNLRRNVRLDAIDIQGLEAWVKFDEQGRSNFSRIVIPEQEESNLTFSYSAMKFSLGNALVHYGDLNRKLSGEARNVALLLEPDEGLSKSEGEVENRRFKFDLTSKQSNFTLDDKPIEPIDVNVKGIVTESYADIAELNLKTPFTESKLSGRLDDFQNLKYKLNLISTVDLQQTGETFKLEQALRGFANLNGTVEGAADKYTVNAQIQSDALAADNVRLKGLRVDASIAGQSDAYEANGNAVAEMLNAGDFELSALQIAGKVMGTGTDFRFLGDLRSAAARIPGGTIGNLIVADAVAEYRDSKLTADAGSVSAASLDAFDAKVRNLRAGGARVVNANGVTTANVSNLRAAQVNAAGVNLRGVNAANVKVQNRDGGATNVNVGRVNAENLTASGANVRNLRAGDVALNINGKAITGNVGSVTADNITASGATVNSVNLAGVDIANNGATTNITADALRVGGVNTAAANLGSLNIAGVRLRIIGSRIEGSTGDINAGTIALNRSGSLPQGGRVENVRVRRPVFVVEPSGRYRASADLSLGGGVLGSIRVGAVRAGVTATSGQIALQNLNAEILEGSVNGNAVVTYEGNAATRLDANFQNLDVAKILALTGGQVVPVNGQTSGRVNLSFPGLNYRRADGTLNADVAAEAGAADAQKVPVTGRIDVRATNGLFDVETANFKTAASEVNAAGRFDLSGSNSNLQVSLNSSDARELQQLISVLNISPDLDKQLAANRIELAGAFVFNASVTGNLQNPTVQGRANLASILANSKNLGALSTDLSLNGRTIALSNGLLAQPDGGNVKFDVTVPNGDTNNVAVNAILDNVDVGGLLAALPAERVPAALQNTSLKTSGSINLTGVPRNINGVAEINSSGGTVAGESFDSLTSRVTFQNSNILIERLEARLGEGLLSVKGNYAGETAGFNVEATGSNLAIARFRGLFGENPPNVIGTLDFTARGTGELAFTNSGSLDFSGFDVNFSGAGKEIALNNQTLGDVNFVGKTQNKVLTTNVTATLGGQQLTALATLNFGDETLPFQAQTIFNNTDLAPLAALAQQMGSIALGGRATGTANFGGALRSRDANGNLAFSTDNLRGNARFSVLTLQVEDVVLTATDPLAVSFSPTQVTFENAKFTGSGSNLTISGTAVFAGGASNNLAADGTINLRVLNAFTTDQFFGGIAEVSARFSGTGAAPKLIGSAGLKGVTFTTIVSGERLTATNINGRVLFNTNQAQIESLEGRLGGGRFTASGGVLLDNLQLQSYRVDLRADDVTAPLPGDVRASADADIQISGVRRDGALRNFVSGSIFANRIEYFKDIEISELLTTRTASTFDTGLSDDTGALGTVQIDLRIEGREALVIRNNIAELTGSVSLRVTGDISQPLISGRVTASGGSITLLNNQRYDITRATIDFPGQPDASPIVNFQGESDINGYQVSLGAVGPISEPEKLQLILRSNPSLPQADVVSLVTTGSLSNAEGGIPTIAQTGVNTAASVVTDALVSAPIRRATDRLFGLNRFEIDPTLAGQRGVSPGARLTVGRQINRNLSVTFSTNLSSDRNQIIALEYRVSNRVSLIAQYEQAPVSNVTRRNDNFNFGVRFRRRF